MFFMMISQTQDQTKENYSLFTLERNQYFFMLESVIVH